MDRATEVAIITGVSGGIGRALAIGFSRDGTKVVGIARNEQKLHETANACPDGMMDSIVGDISSEEDVDRLFSHTLDRYGKVDVLINNAAVYPKGDDLGAIAAGMVRGPANQSPGCPPLQPQGPPSHDGEGLWTDHQPGILRGSWCRPGKFRLFGLQGCGHEPDQGPWRRDQWTLISKYLSK